MASLNQIGQPPVGFVGLDIIYTTSKFHEIPEVEHTKAVVSLFPKKTSKHEILGISWVFEHVQAPKKQFI